jgi:serine protease Do
MKMKPIAAALAAAGLLAAGSASAWNLKDLFHRPASVTTAANAATSQPAPIPPLAAPSGTVPNYRAIVQERGPAVVGVTVEGTRKVASADMPDFSNDPFFQFFRGLPGWRFTPPHGAVPFRGQGSGFIISPDGLILTNAHVVRDAKEVTVKLTDRREYRAKVLGSDPATDIAVLKIDAKNLPVVALGDPNQVHVGDYVLAIGAPYGFEESATQGIVSAKGRSLPGDSYVPFIQTDAAVNPGNSGGPLFDASGRVIGINAEIYSRSGGFQGLAFAIPIDVAMHVKDQILKTGHVEHARLGVLLQDLNQSLAESFGLKSPDGALISSVSSGSAAAKADLKPGDVITRIDGEKVRTASDISTRIGMAAPGDEVKLTVWRDKASREIDVKLGALPSSGTEQVASDGSPGSLGLAVRPLTSGEKREAQTDHGLMVEESDGAAARAGIEPGDVVLSLNGKPVNSVEQIRHALASHPKHVALLIQRNDQRIFVPIDLG